MLLLCDVNCCSGCRHAGDGLSHSGPVAAVWAARLLHLKVTHDLTDEVEGVLAMDALPALNPLIQIAEPGAPCREGMEEEVREKLQLAPTSTAAVDQPVVGWASEVTQELCSPLAQLPG